MLNIVCKPHRTYLKAETDEPQKLFVMMRLLPDKAISHARPPLALALVIDTSDSMRAHANHKTKLDYALDSAHQLIDDPHLEEKDCITLIQFDDESNVVLPLSTLKDRVYAHQMVEVIRNYSGATFMGKGLNNALIQLSQEGTQVAKRVILLTDGHTFDEASCRNCMEKLAGTNAPIVSIGIGLEYNQDLLMELANHTKGYHLHLMEMNQLQNFFTAEIKTMVREVVTDLQLKVAAVKGITLETCSRVYPNLVEVSLEQQPLRLGNIAAGDYTVFILEFQISDIFRPPSRARLARVNLSGNIPSMQSKPGDFPQQEIFITFTKDDAQLALIDPEVLDYVQQKNLDKLIYQAMNLTTKGDTEGARRTLQMAQNITIKLQNTGATQMLQGALEELNKSGSMSANTMRTVRAAGRTMTIKSSRTAFMDAKLSDEEIRKITGI